MQRGFEWWAFWWVAFLAWSIFMVGTAAPAEGASWRDVKNKHDEVAATMGAGCRVWVEAYGTNNRSYRVWERCTTRGTNARASWGNIYEFPNAATTPTNKSSVGTMYSCNWSVSTSPMGLGQPYFGGGVHYDPGGSYPYEFNSGPASYGTIGRDCVGGSTGTMTSQPTTLRGLASYCPIGYGRDTVNCLAMDVLKGTYENTEDGTCQTFYTGLMDKQGKRNHSCGCIPRGYAGTVMINQEANVCQSVRVIGDPSYFPGGATVPGGAGSTDATDGAPRITGEPGTGGEGTEGGTGTTPTVPGTPGGGTEGQTGSSSVPVSGGGPGGAVVVSGTAAGNKVATSTKDELDDDAENTPLPPLPGEGEYDGSIESITPEEQDWPQLVRDFMANSIPLVAAIRGSGVQVSSELCQLDSSFMGQTISFDFCVFESILQTFGVFVVGIASLYSLLIITGRA